MQWDWSPTKPIFLDFETQSMLSLGGSTDVKTYISHPSTSLIMLTVTDGEVMYVWVPKDRCKYANEFEPKDIWPDQFGPMTRSVSILTSPSIPPPLLRLCQSGTLVAHNAEGFDVHAWNRFIKAPAVWCDTMPSARAAGLPAGLDKLQKRFVPFGKDEGKDAIKLLWAIKLVRGKPVVPVGTAGLWRQAIKYNVADVLGLELIYKNIGHFGEADVLQAHSAINERGIHVDRKKAEELQKCWDDATAEAVKQLPELTGDKLNGANIRSGPALKNWLEKQGCHVANLQRKELEKLYESPEGFFEQMEDDHAFNEHTAKVIKVLKIRQQVTRTTTGKLKRLSQLADEDDRVRNLLVYHKANTGRWAGRGLQPHNLPRGVTGVDIDKLMNCELTLDRVIEETDRLRAEAKPVERERINVDDVLSTLFRSLFTAEEGNSLLIADYASIEARGVAWVAGEKRLLGVFERNEDAYKTMASVIYGKPVDQITKDERFIGKQVVLGSGYGMSYKKFDASCKVWGINLAAANTNAEACIKAYRKAYSKISGLWKELGTSVMRCVMRGKPEYAGRCHWRMQAGSLCCTLPSGREMWYRNARIEQRVPMYCLLYNLAPFEVDTIVYDHPRGHDRVLYGGLITENVVQAIARDILATALVNLEDAGIPVVLHVHDEVVAEVPNSRRLDLLDKFAKAMSQPPEWAKDFPIMVEGWEGKRYTKSAGEGSKKIVTLNGELCR